MLGGARHFGYYAPGAYWPFPIGKHLRAMEDNLIESLDLPKGSKVLDAGCGAGFVAVHLGKKGYYVHGIDVVDHHLVKARRNIKAYGLEAEVTATKGDYHHLNQFEDGSFDGAYTMETLVHATEPEAAISEFYRVIRPGGSLVLYEYDHIGYSNQTNASSSSWQTINKLAAMPAYDRFKQGVLKTMLEGAGFVDVKVTDLSDNVLPMMRMFYLLAFVPYLIIALLGLKSKFANTVAAYEGYTHRASIRYVRVSARKPLDLGAIAGEPKGEAEEGKKLW